MLAGEKYSGLFCLIISDEEKSFITLPAGHPRQQQHQRRFNVNLQAGASFIKLVFFVTDAATK
jgi:hypothetical protein